MEVEVKQTDGFYLKALVNDISDDSFDVIYDNGWRKPEWVKFEQCRVEVDASSDKAKNQQPVKVGDVVDAYVRYEGDKRAWHSMKIRDIKNCFAVVEGNEGQNVINDIVPITDCRHPNLSMVVTNSSIQSCVIPAGDLFEYFEQSDERYKVLRESITGILIKLDKEKKELVIKALSPTIIKKVDILKDVFLTNSRQKMTLIQRQEEQKKMLSIHEPNIAAPLLVEFDVSINFMGMAIGSQGANITSARSLDGIKDIILDESTRNQGFCKFKIYANNAEAAERARNMLEISQQQKLVPQGRVGQVIGKQGKTIQDIVDKSGVLRVQIGDENPEQGMVPLTFTGTREALMYAELMVDFQLKHISEMDAIRLEEEEIRRKLYMSRSSPYNAHYGNNSNQSVQPYHRNRPDGGNARAVNGGDGGDRRSMGVSGYRGTGGGGAGQGGGQRFPIRDGGAGQRGAGVTTGRFQSNQNSGNTFGARPQGGNRYLGRSAGGREEALELVDLDRDSVFLLEMLSVPLMLKRKALHLNRNSFLLKTVRTVMIAKVLRIVLIMALSAALNILTRLPSKILKIFRIRVAMVEEVREALVEMLQRVIVEKTRMRIKL
uniref:K Homology domain-containing protein n=1 Tax=Meloidogyne enterolobii TaxID=390850 RepID=A0A6V7W7E9_MELEN|nr:unnamed protein product [Meloidogyne enterolobii]